MLTFAWASASTHFLVVVLTNLSIIRKELGSGPLLVSGTFVSFAINKFLPLSCLMNRSGQSTLGARKYFRMNLELLKPRCENKLSFSLLHEHQCLLPIGHRGSHESISFCWYKGCSSSHDGCASLLISDDHWRFTCELPRGHEGRCFASHGRCWIRDREMYTFKMRVLCYTDEVEQWWSINDQ